MLNSAHTSNFVKVFLGHVRRIRGGAEGGKSEVSYKRLTASPTLFVLAISCGGKMEVFYPPSSVRLSESSALKTLNSSWDSLFASWNC